MTSTRCFWYAYIVECANGSLYTGMSNDVEGRVVKHNKGKGAKYTRSFGPCVLVWKSLPFMLPTSAMIMENEIKRLTRVQKLMLVYGTSDHPPTTL